MAKPELVIFIIPKNVTPSGFLYSSIFENETNNIPSGLSHAPLQ